MGDWGYGPSDNDDAADWIYEVEASDGLGAVRTKLTQVLDVEGELESPSAYEGLAAAGILAIAIGHGSSAITRTFSAWISTMNECPTNVDLALGFEALPVGGAGRAQGGNSRPEAGVVGQGRLQLEFGLLGHPPASENPRQPMQLELCWHAKLLEELLRHVP